MNKTMSDFISKHQLNIDTTGVNYFCLDAKGEKITNKQPENVSVTNGKNVIFIYTEGTSFKNCSFRCHGNNAIMIQSSHREISVNAVLEDHADLYCGNNFSAVNCKMYISKGCEICIGDDNLWSYNAIARTTDNHTILDMNGNILNKPSSIYTGNHVWFGLNVMLLKGASIPSNSVVGVQSIVNKKFDEEYCCIAGIPAKIVKRNVKWVVTSPSEFN